LSAAKPSEIALLQAADDEIDKKLVCNFLILSFLKKIDVFYF
jgi:hypothetical protein